MSKIILPRHLKKETRRWIRKIIADYELEDHHVKILVSAGECWDRITLARECIRKVGAYGKDRFGCIRSNPGLRDERDNRIIFARLIRELNLSEEPPGPRPPGLKY
jgi:hypothetical protein